MKILMINNFFSKEGGAEVYMYSVAKLLRSNGHEVFFFATDKKSYFEENYQYKSYFPKYIDFSKLSFMQLTRFIPNPFYFYNFEAEYKLDKYLKEIKPDIVHCNTVTYYLSPSVLNACKKNNIPVVMTLHEVFFACPSRTMAIGSNYCDQELCIKGNPIHCITNRCNDGHLFKSIISASEYFLRRIHKLYNEVSAYVCPSNAILEMAVRSGIPREKLSHISNFVDNSYFEIKPEYSDRGYFLYAGRLIKEKGVNYLLEAMTKLPDIELHIVGSGPEEKNLKNIAQKLNLTNVKFLGFKTGKDLENEYNNCIATILPCNWFETFGLTIIESFLYGKPVIASNIAAIPEIIDNYKNGILVEPKNVEMLSDKIRELYQNPEKVIEFGKNARIKGESKYKSDIFYSKLVKIYNDIKNR